MPFDPVRDAVANSPLNQSFALPSPFPTPQPSSSQFPFPPTSKRTSNLSMLLNGPEQPPQKKQRLASLLSPKDDSEPLPSDYRPTSSSSTSSSHLPHTTFTQSPPMAHLQIPKLQYQPHRITKPSSVLRPLSESEARSFISLNKLRSIDRSNQPPPPPPPTRPTASNSPRLPRTADAFQPNPSISLPIKRGRDEPPPDDRAVKRARDGDAVAHHYNARRDVGVHERQASPIIGLKRFNNWIKSVLIAKYAAPAFLSSMIVGPPSRGRDPPSRGKVLDMGCGKGGDLEKWSKARIREYVGMDIAAVSIDQARGRWQDMQRRPTGRFDGEFASLDCYSFPISNAISSRRLIQPFDAVSLQFCMHYAFESEAKVRMMLSNVSGYLREGGVFIGTTPNADILMDKLNAIPQTAPDLSFGNAVYNIRFEDRKKRLYGQKYHFFLNDAVDVPEYVVHWSEFERLALEYNLHCRCRMEFHELFDENREVPEFQSLLQRMKVMDENGESQMDEDQWEAANIYLAFAFEKQTIS